MSKSYSSIFFVINFDFDSYIIVGDYMNNLIEEIVDCVKLPFNEIVNDTKIIMLSNKVFYVSNYKKILSYSNEKLSLKISNDFIEFQGDNFIISQINKSEIIIRGKIKSFHFGSDNDK